MKKIILILMISVSLANYSKSMDQNQLESRNIKVKRSFRNKFTDTKVVAYCENGKIIYKGNFKNGKKDGEWTTYYEDGKIKWKTNYKDGKSIDDGTISRFTN